MVLPGLGAKRSLSRRMVENWHVRRSHLASHLDDAPAIVSEGAIRPCSSRAAQNRNGQSGVAAPKAAERTESMMKGRCDDDGRDDGGRAVNRAMLAQIVRYAIVGVGVTTLQAAVYWLLAQKGGIHPQLANFLGYLCAVGVGYVAHGAITFRGHGKEAAASPARAARFVAVSLFSLALNAFWVWSTVSWAGLPLWAPIPLMGVVTPGFIFLLNRQWVFR